MKKRLTKKEYDSLPDNEKSKFKLLGSLDPDFSPGGGEDIEYCLQVEQLGYKILQVPSDDPCKTGPLGDGTQTNVNLFPSYHKSEGTVMDKDNNNNDKWIKHIADVRAKLEYKYKLPKGWFYGGDIAEYRRIVEDIPEEGTIGELGCAWGRSICSVADIIKRKNLKVHIVDCFVGTPGEASYGEKFRKEFEDNIKRFDIFDRVIIHEGYTNDIVKEVDDKTFDLLFIDADHSYESVKRDIEDWLPKMKDHATISGHDYCNGFGVSKAVNEKWSNIRVHDIQFGIPGGVAQGSVWSKRL